MSTIAAAAPVASPRSVSERLASIDVIRGLDILVMMFVNDVAGVTGTPPWMKHIDPPLSDGMTFVDVVFPAFLFIVGMSIPLALGRRSRADALKHVLVRAVALLIIGLFMINSGGAGGLLPKQVWVLFMYLGVICVWGTTIHRRGAEDAEGQRGAGVKPADSRRNESNLAVLSASVVNNARWIGIAILLAAALLYDHKDRTGLIELRPSWWGIIGLIGWAYLVASLVYLAGRGRLLWLALGTIALYALYMADSAGWLPAVPFVKVGSMLGSHAALVLSGAFFTAGCLVRAAPFADRRITFAFGCGAVMAALATALHAFADVHAMFTINKILATPAWCLWSAAITLWIWAGVYWLLDVRRIAVPGRGLLERSGQNALLAYILAPIFYALVALVPGGKLYGVLGDTFWTGFFRSLVFAVFIVWVAAALRRKGMMLKL